MKMIIILFLCHFPPERDCSKLSTDCKSFELFTLKHNNIIDENVTSFRKELVGIKCQDRG